jgi:hypothetical protein
MQWYEYKVGWSTCCLNCGQSVSDMATRGELDDDAELLEAAGVPDDDAEHVCEFGPWELSRLGGNAHRKCSGCKAISLDGDDDSDE